MSSRDRILGVVLALTASILLQSSVRAEDLDPNTGLVMQGDWQLIRTNCIACHSAKLITQQRASKSQWLEMIRWMQASQNLWSFEADTEERIINYLSTNYSAKENRRRSALAPSLMPRSLLVGESESTSRESNKLSAPSEPHQPES